MNRTSSSRMAAVLAFIALPLLAIPAGASAQNGQSAPPPPATSNAAASVSEPTLPKSMSEKVEQHIRRLRDQLDITAAEGQQWQQFAQVMRDNAAQMAQALEARGTTLGSMNATDNMQSYAQLAQVHATNMQKLASAFQSLYNSFPEDQKKVADDVFRNEHRKPLPAKH